MSLCEERGHHRANGTTPETYPGSSDVLVLTCVDCERTFFFDASEFEDAEPSPHAYCRHHRS